MKKINEKHKLFVEEYLNNGLNGTQAYLAVYKNVTKEETARANASRLLAKANVKALLEEKQAKTIKKMEMTREGIIKKAIQITELYDEVARLAMIDDPTLEEELKYARLVNIIKASDSNTAINTILKANGWNEPDKLDVNIKNYKANFGN